MPIHRISKKIGPILLALGVMAWGSLISTPARAQVVGATLSGTLQDASGAVVPGGQLTITNLATGIQTTVAANASGFYTAPNLVPGSYEMTATASGYATEKLTGLTLEVGAQLVENFTLKVGQTTQQVEVDAGSVPQIELASSTIAATVNSATVVELPLNGRSWTDLTALEPGAVPLANTQVQMTTIQSATSRATDGLGNQTSIDGARPDQNNYRLNGISINDFANGPAGNVGGETLGVDAIQEFSVLTSNYSAEYGMTSGGVINAISRSGSNQLHGSAYWFLRNDVFDARNYFDAPGTIPPFRRNQFGGSVGGPIRTDRTFFFADYEGLRQLKSISVVNIVPSTAAWAGTLCTAPSTPTACKAQTIKVNSSVLAYMPFYRLPNAGLLPTGNGDTGYFNYPAAQSLSDNYFTTRIDHRFSAKDTLAGTFTIERSPFSLPDNFGNMFLQYTDHNQVYSIEETHIFSANLVNTVRVGALRQHESTNQLLSTPNPLMADTTLGIVPGQTASQVIVTGLASFSGGTQGSGLGIKGFTTPQLYDDASWVRGRHSIKFGFAGERQIYDWSQTPIAGMFHFGSLANFLQNVPSSVTSATINLVGYHRGLSDYIIGAYVQDDWRWRPNLTLNLGFRYEMLTNPIAAHGYESSLTSMTAATPRVGNPEFLSNPTLRDFEPRAGFAWDPFRNGKTSVRGGGGLFDVLPMAYELYHSMLNVYPLSSSQTTSTPPAGTFYNGIEPYFTPASNYMQYVQQNPSRIYVMQWNFSIQRELAPNLALTLGYAGSGGVRLPVVPNDGNATIPTLTSAGWLYPAPVKSGAKINPNWGAIHPWFFIGHSNYDALLATVTKKMAHGFQTQGSFTWGKSIDDGSSSINAGSYANTEANLDWFSTSLLRGPSDFDIRRNLVINGIWQVPQTKVLGRSVGRVVNGWQFNGIYRASDGVPFTPTFGTGGNPDGENSSSTVGYPDRISTSGPCHSAINPRRQSGYINTSCFSLPTAPNMAFWTANCDTTSKIYGSPATTEPYPVCLNLRGNAGKNSLTAPGLQNMDFSAFKNNKIGERYNLQFRAEFFNIFNRTDFGAPGANSDIYTSTGTISGSAGVLTGTGQASREIQFAMKLTW